MIRRLVPKFQQLDPDLGRWKLEQDSGELWWVLEGSEYLNIHRRGLEPSFHMETPFRQGFFPSSLDLETDDPEIEKALQRIRTPWPGSGRTLLAYNDFPDEGPLTAEQLDHGMKVLREIEKAINAGREVVESILIERADDPSWVPRH